MYRIVKDAVRVDRLLIKLFTKVIPIFEYYIGINFWINNDFCIGYKEIHIVLE